MSTFSVLWILTITLLPPVLLQGEERANASIQAVIAAMSDALSKYDAAAFASYFSSDADVWIESHHFNGGPAAAEHAVEKPGFWTEVTAPTLETIAVHPLADNLALADAARVRFANHGVRKEPVLFVFIKDHGRWRVASMRIGCRLQATAHIEVLHGSSKMF